MISKKVLFDIAGWYGAIAVLVCFFLVSFGYISPRSISYLLGNATGAVGLIIEARNKKDYPSGFLNIAYLIIALVAILRIF